MNFIFKDNKEILEKFKLMEDRIKLLEARVRQLENNPTTFNQTFQKPIFEKKLKNVDFIDVKIEKGCLI